MIKIKLTWGLQSIRIEDYIREQEENTWVAWHFVRIENFLTGLSSETRKWHLGDRRRIHDWKYVALYKKFELDFSWLGSTIQERMIVIYDFRQPFLDPTDAQEYLNKKKSLCSDVNDLEGLWLASLAPELALVGWIHRAVEWTIENLRESRTVLKDAVCTIFPRTVSLFCVLLVAVTIQHLAPDLS